MDNDNEFHDTQQLETFLPIQPHSDAVPLDDEALSAVRANELNKLFLESTLPKGFYFDNDGWLAFVKETDGETSSVPVRICSRLEVIARTRDQLGENHGRLLQFYDPDGMQHRWAMPMALLAGDGISYRQELLSKGLMIDTVKSARQLLTIYIQTSSPTATVRCVEQTGWNKDCTAFVFQNETVGNSGNEPLILQNVANLRATQAVSGSLEEWQQLAGLCIGNSRLLFAVSAAFAPPLLRLFGEESGGIHFRGGSSSGKTTCLRAAASVWGGWDYVQQWRTTVNGLEGTAASHNDCLLCLDEMGQIDSNEVGKAAYMLANGRGKGRADKLGNPKKQKQWDLLFLSSGEISLAGLMAEAKQQVRGGQEVRVLDIPADGQAFGCFDNLHNYQQGNIFAERIADLCKSYHGTAGIAFVNAVLLGRDKIIKDSRALMSGLSKKYVPLTASGQVSRAFNRFALIAAAGELATSLGITGWSEGAAIEAAIRCFNDWLGVRGDMGPQEERAILSQIRHFFEQHGDSRFTPWDKDGHEMHGKTQMRVGFRKQSEGGEEFFVFKESFKRDISTGFDPEVVAKVCIKNGLLEPDPRGGATRSERLPGMKKSTRVYRFTAKVLSEGEGSN